MTLFQNTDRRGFKEQALAGSTATMLLVAWALGCSGGCRF